MLAMDRVQSPSRSPCSFSSSLSYSYHHHLHQYKHLRRLERSTPIPSRTNSTPSSILQPVHSAHRNSDPVPAIESFVSPFIYRYPILIPRAAPCALQILHYRVGSHLYLHSQHLHSLSAFSDCSPYPRSSHASAPFSSRSEGCDPYHFASIHVLSFCQRRRTGQARLPVSCPWNLQHTEIQELKDRVNARASPFPMRTYH